MNKNKKIEEGWFSDKWEDAKYGLSKLGRYKAGGKILGKQDTDRLSQQKRSDILARDKNRSDQFINKLDQIIKNEYPGFPNIKDQQKFLSVIIAITAIYETIVKNANSNRISVQEANDIITDLREYVKEILDVDLAAVYTVFRENVQDKRDFLNKRFANVKNNRTINTERGKTLRSWRLPGFLMGLGANFGALGWIINTLFPEEIIKKIDIKVIKDRVEAVLGTIKSEEGMTQIFNRVLGTKLTKYSNPQEVVDILTKLGAGNAQAGVNVITQEGGIFTNPEAARKTLTEFIQNPTAKGNTLQDVFKPRGTWAGDTVNPQDTLSTKPGRVLSKLIIKTIINTSKSTTIKAGAAAIATPVLYTIGAVLVASALGVALARYKGRKASRAQFLDDLVQYLKPIQGNNRQINNTQDYGDFRPDYYGTQQPSRYKTPTKEEIKIKLLKGANLNDVEKIEVLKLLGPYVGNQIDQTEFEEEIKLLPPHFNLKLSDFLPKKKETYPQLNSKPLELGGRQYSNEEIKEKINELTKIKNKPEEFNELALELLQNLNSRKISLTKLLSKSKAARFIGNQLKDVAIKNNIPI